MIRNIKLQKKVGLFKNMLTRLFLRTALTLVFVVATVTPSIYAQDATQNTNQSTNSNTAQNTPLNTRQIAGVLTGGNFDKIYLELRPDAVSASVTLLSDWNRDPASPSEVGFFILDSDQFARVLGGGSLLENNAAAANPRGNSNQLGVTFNADSIFPYTLVIYNDGSRDAEFTLTATNAIIIDGSGRVRDPSKSPAPTQNNSAQNNTTGTTSTTDSITTTSVAAPTALPTVAPTPTAVATTPATTAGTTSDAAPAAPTAAPKVLRANTVAGELPEQYNQHFLGLEVDEKDGSIDLTFTFDPQDNSELARRSGFWVLDEKGLNSYINGSRPSEVAIAAGSRLFDGNNNVRTASFRATGNELLTVLVFNNSEIPATYQLTAKGATLIDDAGQTTTAKKLSPATTSVTGTTSTDGGSSTASTTTSTATTNTATTSTATTGTTATTTESSTAAAPSAPTAVPPTATPTQAATTASSPKAGSSYTIKSGDSISAITRDVYGDINLYDELCAYNKLANCALIEVGDVIQLPAQKSDLTSGAVAATQATTNTTTAQPTATPTKAAVSSSTTATKTQSVTTTQSVTATANVTTTKPATTTKPVTTTNTVTSTKPVTTTATTTTTATSDAKPAGDIISLVQGNENFTILNDFLKVTGSDKLLKGNGPYTVFAPTDAAFNALFDALPDGAVDQLKANPNATLKQIILFHVVANSITAEDLEDGAEAVTLQGSNISFQKKGESWKVQDSNMTTNDIDANNGVIHVIDKVMLPPKTQ